MSERLSTSPNPNPETDWASLSDEELLDKATDPASPEDTQKIAEDTIHAREEQGVFDYNRGEPEPPTEHDANLQDVKGYDPNSPLNDAPSADKIHQRATYFSPFRATETIPTEDIDGHDLKIARAHNDKARTLERQQARENKVQNPLMARELTIEEEGTNRRAEQEYVEQQKARSAEHSSVVANIKKRLLANESDARRSFVSGAMAYLAEGDLSAPAEHILSDGYDSVFSSQILHYLKPGRNKYSNKERLKNIEDAAATEYVEAVNPEKIKDFERAALHAAVKRGITVETDPVTEEQTRTFALPIAEKGDGPLQDYMAEKGFDAKSDDTRIASYGGFHNIVNAIKNDKEPDFAPLDWYFENFGYGNHVDEFKDAIAGSVSGDQKAGELFDAYLKQSRLVEQAEKKDSPIFDENSEKINRDRIQKIMEERGLDSYEAVLKILHDAGVIEGLFPSPEGLGPTPPGPEPLPGPEPHPGPRPESSLAFQRLGSVLGVFTAILMEVDPEAEIFVPRKVAKAIKAASGTKDHYTSPVENRSNSSYFTIRFGAEGKNHVISECCNFEGGATYAWQGESEFGENNDWMQIFSQPRSAIRYKIRQKDPSVANVTRRNHSYSRTPLEQMKLMLSGHLSFSYDLDNPQLDGLSESFYQAILDWSKKQSPKVA